MLLLAAAAALAGDDGTPLPCRTIGPTDYQSFAANWDEAAAPVRCARIRTPEQWAALFHPAPFGFGTSEQARPFAPDAEAFEKEELLVVARVVPAAGEGDAQNVFRLESVTQREGTVSVRYGYTEPRGPASFKVKQYLGVWIPADAYRRIEFVENGRTSGVLDAAKGEWAIPPERTVAKPSPEQVAYLEMERQMFVCLDPCTWQGREYDNHSTPLERINPAQLDADQWCRAAESWGARQILFVAKHTGGFCWWQTETSDYGIRNTPWKGGKGDVLAELSEACRRHGLKLAIYVYPGDDQWGAGIGSGGRTKDPAKQEAYNQVFRQQMTEVLTRYGEMSEVWFDGSCQIEVGDLLRTHAPHAMVFQGPHTTLRWVGNERGYAPYPAWQTVKKKDAATGVSTAAHSDPDGDVWLPMECDTTLIDHKWFWAPNTDHKLKRLDQLMDIYEKSAGRGCVLLLNSTPDTTGRIPDSHMALYEAFGREMARRYGSPLAETNGAGEVVELDLGRPMAVNATILQEDIREGQRVRAYRLEGFADGAWVPLHTKGLSIGQKQIDRFPAATISRLRLVVTASAGEPLIRRLAAFHVTEAGAAGADPVAAWTVAARWKAPDFPPAGGTVDLDISPGVPQPAQYEVEFRAASGALVVEAVELVIDGQVLPGRVRRVEGRGNFFGLQRIEQTTAETPTILRVRAHGGSAGEVRVRRS